VRLTYVGAAFAGLAITATLYLYGLDRVPVYLGLDEAHFGVHGYALKETGRNLNGDRLPLFVNLSDPLGDRPVLPWGNTWYQPVLFYLVAATLYWLPLSEASIRVPMALLGGVVNIALIYAVAWRLSRRHVIATAAAVVLGASPASLILSRQALDYMLPVPFILGWMLCLALHLETGRPQWAFAAGLVLGAGCYSYITSWMMMPAYLAMTVISYVLAAKAPSRSGVMTSAAFALPVLLLLPWLWSHPEFADNVRRQDATADSANPTLLQVASVHGVQAAIRRLTALYWDYFNPSFLFVFGGNSRNMSSGLAGVFPFAVALLLPAGVLALLRRPGRDWITWLLLLGVATAPIPAILKGTPAAIQRATALLPFVALVSAFGFGVMWDSRRRVLRWCAAGLVLAVVAQFAGFYGDYFSGYRWRSARSADATAFSEVAAALFAAVDRDATAVVYLTTPMHDASAKWRFYLTKHGRLDLLDRTRYFDGRVLALPDAAKGSLAVVPLEEVATAGVTESGTWELYRSIADLTGNPVVVIFRKTG
jgi:4-amino-4-deoxy-L-arabinose transferase-like glycosyltransferase